MRDFIADLLSDGLGVAILVVIGAVCLIVVVLVGVAVDRSVRPCLSARWVHHSAWTQMVLVGKVMVPIFHPARTSCDCVSYGARFAPEPQPKAACAAKASR